jgi:hypothetical protein
LKIPFAGQSITWEVVFNSVLPHFPPDFCFDDDTFLADPEIGMIEENVPSLANWDSQDSKSLLYVICELLALYRKHQVSISIYEVKLQEMLWKHAWLLCFFYFMKRNTPTKPLTKSDTEPILF